MDDAIGLATMLSLPGYLILQIRMALRYRGGWGPPGPGARGVLGAPPRAPRLFFTIFPGLRRWRM